MATASEPEDVSVGLNDGFAVDPHAEPPRMTLALSGELDLAGAPLLEREIEALDWPQFSELVFDLGQLTFIDSTGLSVLIRAVQRARASGLQYSVVRVPEQPQKLFGIAGVTDSLNAQP